MIPLQDIPALHAPIQQELEAAVLGVLRSGQYCLGPEVEAFEREFAAHCRCTYGVGVNSGTSALHLALLACGVKPGDEVITVPFTFIATVAAIRYCGARPVFVDIEPEGCLMDVERLERAITSRTRAILPVHLYGQVADMDPILEIARRRGLAVVEDAAQAHGAEYKGRRAGSMGDLAAFSFYPGKNLGACGEGGMVVGNDPRHEPALRSLRSWGVGQPGIYQHQLEGFNFRMDNLQAAVLRVKLRRLEEWTAARRRHAGIYHEELRHCAGLRLPREHGGRTTVHHQYCVRTPQRDRLREWLRVKGVATGMYYPIPIHLLAPYAELGHREGDFPVSEAAARETLALPVAEVHAGETIREIARLVREEYPW